MYALGSLILSEGRSNRWEKRGAEEDFHIIRHVWGFEQQCIKCWRGKLQREGGSWTRAFFVCVWCVHVRLGSAARQNRKVELFHPQSQTQNFYFSAKVRVFRGCKWSSPSPTERLSDSSSQHVQNLMTTIELSNCKTCRIYSNSNTESIGQSVQQAVCLNV